MATLTVQEISRTGLEATFDAAAAGGDEFINTGKEFVEVVNGSGSNITVTIATQETVDDLAVADRTVVVTAGERRHIGPFTGTYEDANKKVQLTYSDVTTLTVAVLRLGA